MKFDYSYKPTCICYQYNKLENAREYFWVVKTLNLNNNMMLMCPYVIQLRKWKSLRKHSLHVEYSSLGFFKLFISGNKSYQTTDAT